MLVKGTVSRDFYPSCFIILSHLDPLITYAEVFLFLCSIPWGWFCNFNDIAVKNKYMYYKKEPVAQNCWPCFLHDICFGHKIHGLKHFCVEILKVWKIFLVILTPWCHCYRWAKLLGVNDTIDSDSMLCQWLRGILYDTAESEQLFVLISGSL